MFAVLAAFSSQVLPQASQSRSVIPILASDAVVQDESIRLADLLPINVNGSVRVIAERVSLGRAPEPGSVRVLTLEELRKAIDNRFDVEIPAQVTVRRAGWPISPERIRDAGQVFRPQVDWSQARIVPPELAIRVPDAKLRAREIRAGRNPRTVMLRLLCRDRTLCAPFWAEAIFDQPVNILASPNASSAQAAAVPTSPLVRPGRLARLVSEDNGLRITMRVMPLRRAGLGESVRVFDPFTRRTFLAQVRGTDLLQSDLRKAK